MTSAGTAVLRQSTVIAAAVFMLIGATIGGGALGGTPVQDLQDGALSAQGSYLAPAGPAFAIWSVIYVGLIGYTVWQALPSQREDPRQMRTGWWVALSMLLNGLWLVTAQFLTLPLTVLVIAALLAVLAVIIVRLDTPPARGWVDRLLLDGVMGLHFGWVTIATVANTAAWLTQSVPDQWAQYADAWGIAVLVVVLVIAALSGIVTGRIAPALATSWGLAWLAVGRITDQPRSDAIGITAIIVAGGILVAAVAGSVRRQRRRAADTPS
ncbi:TspO/MBR family protein [Microbacterium esteraromaticum]|uniref:TspO/MBR family protein n=1 Tax=Microbacterium esteraromaticum TaxID=57043 RepID=UPI0019D3590C|nr:TspO/MBR family protein [Microbacterium esteraromaticum]MBN7794211.1 tryptophan-rich sensory protein [Microbacterium esteraromaticum]